MQSKPISNETENIRTILLMAEGNRYELSLSPDAPLLRDLFQVLLNRSEGRAASRVFEIAIDEGHSRLHLKSEALVAIATEPPVEPPPVEPEQIVRDNQPIPTEKKAALPAARILESRYCQIDQFLPETEYNMLLDYVGKQEGAYRSSAGPPTLAESFAELRSQWSDRVQAVLPEVLSQLGIPAFPLSEIETVPYPKPHRPYQVSKENSTPETERRVLSFIYYFYRQPKAFAGGELLLYDSQIEDKNNACIPAESFKSIPPNQNSIVFFFSSYAYQVQPLSPPSLALAQTCFTFQGWLRR